MDLSIFRSYDIRGIYPKELNKEIAFKIGQVFVVHTGAKNVIVGRDMRLSSPELFEALTKGIISQGADVYNIGLVPTEAVYFSVGNYNYDAGIMITASHNPKEYNGFKMIQNKDGNFGLTKSKELINLVEKDISKKELGKINEINIWEDFINHIFSQADLTKIKPLKIVVDAGNGMSGKVIPFIKDRLPVEIISLNFDLDGNFPAHTSNPLEEGVVDQVCREVVRQKADAGFIFDGDADRVYLIDEKGNFIKGDMTLLLLAKYFLKKYPGKGIAYNLICSRAVPEFVKKWGGIPIKTPVGVVNVREGMISNKGVLGGELSGHYLFKESYYLDSGFVAFLILLQLISESNRNVSEIIKDLSIYSKSPELNFRVKNKEKIINKFKNKYFDGQQEEIDGLTIEYKDWWFNVRPSNTEPLLRLTIEADNQKLLDKKIKELKSLL
ncbi:phosphomannomutase/phosphoglucomutase [Patescibacteria group bacterium]|nr:phosphomannomutase/phosphoglucomutase [Patescibacteria group bacterium]